MILRRCTQLTHKFIFSFCSIQSGQKSKPQTCPHRRQKILTDFHHTLTALLQYLVKHKFSNITLITTNTYAETYLIKQMFSN